MTYNTQNPRHKKYNHTMNPKERALHWLNIVTTGMASPIDGVDRDIKPCDSKHRLFLPSPVTAV